MSFSFLFKRSNFSLKFRKLLSPHFKGKIIKIQQFFTRSITSSTKLCGSSLVNNWFLKQGTLYIDSGRNWF